MSLAGYTVLYGGSFNPPHIGHQMACLYFLEALAAGAVWLIPSRRHPFGKPLAPWEDRVELCELLARPFGERAVVSRVEGEAGLSGRTIDTVEHLAREHPTRQFALAIGTDILAETAAWHRWADIEAIARVVVVGRAGYGPADGEIVELPAVSSSEIRERVARGESIDGLVPAAVADYIAEHGLYRP
jgi:nicotinate-nucleotide adenylyltransferase